MTLSARLRFATIALGVLLAGCSSEWNESKTYDSPSGEYKIVVISEVQGANDPEPVWQHISIYRNGEERRSRKGNLFIYSSHDAPIVKWNGAKEVEIRMTGVRYSFSGPLDSLLAREISLHAVVDGSSLRD